MKEILSETSEESNPEECNEFDLPSNQIFRSSIVNQAYDTNHFIKSPFKNLVSPNREWMTSQIIRQFDSRPSIWRFPQQ